MMTTDKASVFVKGQAFEALDPGTWLTSHAISENLHEALPQLLDLVDGAHFNILQMVWGFLRRTPPGATSPIVVQACNDFSDLLVDLYEARGRSATRTARAIIEHLINLLTVVADSNAAARYMDHAPTAAVIEAQAAIGLRRLSGNALKSETHRLRKLNRDAQPALAAAVARHGPQFRRTWAAGNLRDRATQSGVSDLYDYYRFASLVLHGASSGQTGSVREIATRNVYRIGPALSLLPLAYHEGVRAFAKVVEVLPHIAPGLDCARVVDSLDSLLSAWPAYRQAALTLDAQIWPDDPLRPNEAVLAISRTGTRKWFWHETGLGLIVEAEPPIEGDLPQKLREHIEAVAIRHQDLDIRDQWLTITVGGVVLNPKLGARWMNAAAILVPASMGRFLPHPRRVD